MAAAGVDLGGADVEAVEAEVAVARELLDGEGAAALASSLREGPRDLGVEVGLGHLGGRAGQVDGAGSPAAGVEESKTTALTRGSAAMLRECCESGEETQ